MSLLTIVQDTLREIGGVEVPTSVVGNSNETAVRSLALANRSLKETAKRTNWPGLTIRGTITTVASQEEYAIPDDFQFLINDTMWDDTNNRQVFGPLSESDWEFVKNSDAVAGVGSINSFFRIFRSATTTSQVFYLFPIPDSIRTLRFEYRSDALTETSGNVAQGDRFLADTDLSLLDEDIIALGFKWRFLKSFGLPFEEEFRDYEAAIEDGAQADGAGIISLAGPGFVRFGPVVPDGNFG